VRDADRDLWLQIARARRARRIAVVVGSALAMALVAAVRSCT
jgi:hypothetical protein